MRLMPRSAPCRQGLDLVLDLHEPTDAAASEGTPEGTHQALLKRLVESTSAAFIPLSQEIPPLDASCASPCAAPARLIALLVPLYHGTSSPSNRIPPGVLACRSGGALRHVRLLATSHHWPTRRLHVQLGCSCKRRASTIRRRCCDPHVADALRASELTC